MKREKEEKKKEIENRDEITGRCNVYIVAHLVAYFYIEFLLLIFFFKRATFLKIYFCVVHFHSDTQTQFVSFIRMSPISNNKCCVFLFPFDYKYRNICTLRLKFFFSVAATTTPSILFVE